MEIHEKLIMFTFTGASNFWCFPCLYLLYKRKMLFGFMLGVFTFICSFMYHSMESLEIRSLYLTYSEWHRLDNIGSIMALIYLFVFLMDNLQPTPEGIYLSQYENNYDRALCYFGIFITLLMQTKHPWDIENTITPVALYALALTVKVLVVRKPRIHTQNFYKACGILGFGVLCFYKGLDDDNDYLRIWHGIWHLCGSTSLFYFYQSICKERKILGVAVEPGIKYPNLGFWRTFFFVFTFGSLPAP